MNTVTSAIYVRVPLLPQNRARRGDVFRRSVGRRRGAAAAGEGGPSTPVDMAQLTTGHCGNAQRWNDTATRLEHAAAVGPTWAEELTCACEGQGTVATAMATTACHGGTEEARGEAELLTDSARLRVR